MDPLIANSEVRQSVDRKLHFECVPPHIQYQRMHLGELSEDDFYSNRPTLSATWKLEIEKVYVTPKKRKAYHVRLIHIHYRLMHAASRHASKRSSKRASKRASKCPIRVSANEDMHLCEFRL